MKVLYTHFFFETSVSHEKPKKKRTITSKIISLSLTKNPRDLPWHVLKNNIKLDNFEKTRMVFPDDFGTDFEQYTKE